MKKSIQEGTVVSNVASSMHSICRSSPSPVRDYNGISNVASTKETRLGTSSTLQVHCIAPPEHSMTSAVAENVLFSAISTSIRDGSFPESEDVLTADLPQNAIPGILREVLEERQQLEVGPGCLLATSDATNTFSIE